MVTLMDESKVVDRLGPTTASPCAQLWTGCSEAAQIAFGGGGVPRPGPVAHQPQGVDGDGRPCFGPLLLALAPLQPRGALHFVSVLAPTESCRSGHPTSRDPGATVVEGVGEPPAVIGSYLEDACHVHEVHVALPNSASVRATAAGRSRTTKDGPVTDALRCLVRLPTEAAGHWAAARECLCPTRAHGRSHGLTSCSASPQDVVKLDNAK